MGERFQTCSICGTHFANSEDDGLCPKCILATLFPRKSKSDDNEEVDLEIPGLKVREVLGEGGFGRVYLAEQETVFLRRVAVKVLKAGLDTEAVLRRFELEQRALGLLEHPHIARIYDAGETVRGYPYFTMEFVDGIPFTDYFSSCPPKEVVEAMVIVCQAVSYAHERGLIHRDLKPSNILIAENGMPKVIDFGIAKATNPERTPGMTHLTREDTFLGTPEYMAPEQARLDSVALDERVDVFALGAVLFEALLGKTPLEASEGCRTREGVSEFRVENIEAKVWGGRADGVRALLEKCLREPECRYQSVQELRRDLQRLADGQDIVVELPQVRSRRWVLSGVAGVAAVSVGGLLWRYSGKNDSVSTEPVVKHYPMSGVARPLYVNSLSRRALGVFKTGSHLSLLDLENGDLVKEDSWGGAIPQSGCFAQDGLSFYTAHSDGSMRRFQARDGRQIGEVSQLISSSQVRGIHCWGERLVQGEPVLIVREFDEKAIRAYGRDGKALWKLQTPSASWDMEFEPGGIKAAFSGRIGQVCLVDLATQELKVLKPKSRKSRSHSQTLPNDGGFLIAYYDGVVEHWAWSGKLVRQWRAGVGGDTRLQVSPDGARLALVSNMAEVYEWDLAGEREIQTMLVEAPAGSIRFSPDSRELAIGCEDGKIRFWDLEKNHLREDYLKLKKKPYAVQYSPLNEGLIFATASDDGIYAFSTDHFS